MAIVSNLFTIYYQFWAGELQRSSLLLLVIDKIPHLDHVPKRHA